MVKQKQLVEDAIALCREMERIMGEVFDGHYTVPARLTYWTIEQALDSQAEVIAAQPHYPDLTRWPLLEQDEFLMVYNIETKRGRALSDHDLEYIGGDGSQLTPAGMRRWYLNRKDENEYLVSDAGGANLWLPE